MEGREVGKGKGLFYMDKQESCLRPCMREGCTCQADRLACWGGGLELQGLAGLNSGCDSLCCQNTLAMSAGSLGVKMLP